MALAFALLIALAGGTLAALTTNAQSLPAVDCMEWHRCRELALAAAERGEYETFHDLAWRAVQTGPRKEPALMYLLARAQSLSGRPHDALVMLQRLAEMGVASDAATNDDFRRARQHRYWPEVEVLIAGVTASRSVSSVTSPDPGLSVTTLAPATQGLRFSTTRFAISGLAYDALSRRFVLGDRAGRKLFVVDERSSHTTDLVRADSAGFLDIAAVEIDAKRGDLWVASTTAAGGSGVLHKLQLVSGRPLRAFPVGVDLGPVNFVDLVVGPTGAVLVLDAATPQLLVLGSGGTALQRVVRIDAPQPVSVASGDDGTAFVAHRDGLSRIDLRSRTVTLVANPNGIPLGQFERIRWRGNALLAVQVDGDGSRRLLRLELNARGSAIARATRLEIPAPAVGQMFMTISGDELLYLMPGSEQASQNPSSNASSDQEEFVAYRVPVTLTVQAPGEVREHTPAPLVEGRQSFLMTTRLTSSTGSANVWRSSRTVWTISTAERCFAPRMVSSRRPGQ